MCGKRVPGRRDRRRSGDAGAEARQRGRPGRGAPAPSPRSGPGRGSGPGAVWRRQTLSPWTLSRGSSIRAERSAVGGAGGVQRGGRGRPGCPQESEGGQERTQPAALGQPSPCWQRGPGERAPGRRGGPGGRCRGSGGVRTPSRWGEPPWRRRWRISGQSREGSSRSRKQRPRPSSPREGAAWTGAWLSDEVGGGRVNGALGSDSLPHSPRPPAPHHRLLNPEPSG